MRPVEFEPSIIEGKCGVGLYLENPEKYKKLVRRWYEPKKARAKESKQEESTEE
ncbi:MAG: hypothetical protein OEY90_06425 [Candidatus Bathyarchaeota archaeon]|nr:hypothetical protein [Candidatus Bathyarchaeota archaeon]